MNPTVVPGRASVMMPAYNAARFLPEAIDSVLAQTRRAWELVVVDDGSTDGTAAIADGYGDRRIVVVHRENGGEGAARNTALDHLSGEYLAFLDADDAWMPDHLEQAVGYLETHADDIGVYTDGYHVTEDGRRLRSLSSRRRGPMTGRIFDEVVRGSDVFGPPICVVVRRDPVVRHGLRFDESLAIGTDWDFLMRVAALGTFGYLDSVTCRYRLHHANVTAQVGLLRRARELAKCRANAVAHPAFGSCPVDVRAHVFYELLAVWLRDEPDQQEAIVDQPAFAALPAAERARLLRLLASKAILHGGSARAVREWLKRSKKSSPADLHRAVLAMLFHVSPALCRSVLLWWTRHEADPRQTLPFDDMQDELRASAPIKVGAGLAPTSQRRLA